MLDDYKLRYQVSPIILTGGIAKSIPGNMMSILSFFNPNALPSNQPGNFAALATALSQPDVVAVDSYGISGTSLDNAFGAFTVIPGGSLVQQTIPKYPLADMTMAANAIVREPIQLSLIWDTPMRGAKAWAIKLSTFQALKAMLDVHNNEGGLYTILTPAYYYDNCIMVSLTDNSRGDSTLPQNAWCFNFERPMVVSTDDITSAQNIFMSKVTAGTQTNPMGNIPQSLWTQASLGQGQSAFPPTSFAPVSPVGNASLGTSI